MKKLGDTLSNKKTLAQSAAQTAAQLDKIADKIHDTRSIENDDEQPYKLSLELPTWLVKKMKAYGKTNGMTLKGIILVELLKKFEQT
jgi:hypothetical protein